MNITVVLYGCKMFSHRKKITYTRTKISVLWETTPWCLMEVNRRFGGASRLHLQCPLAFILVFCSAYSSTWRWRQHIPPKHRLTFDTTLFPRRDRTRYTRNHRCRDLKSYINTDVQERGAESNSWTYRRIRGNLGKSHNELLISCTWHQVLLRWPKQGRRVQWAVWHLGRNEKCVQNFNHKSNRNIRTT
jgi:hypothetical protein